MTFGERLQAALDAQGINRAELCRRTGLKSANLVPYMKPGSDRSPKLSTAILIADALGVSLDYLAGRASPPPPPAYADTRQRRMNDAYEQLDEPTKDIASSLVVSALETTRARGQKQVQADVSEAV